MRETKIWRDKYKDISFEINNFQIGDTDQWTFYLIIRLEQMPEKIRDRFWLKPSYFKTNRKWKMKRRMYYNYNEEPLIENIVWHGGCTWYSKLKSFDDPKNKVIQIGCDYAHAWDQGQYYNIDFVLSETKTAIDSLYRLIPNIKHHCGYCGKYGLKNYISRKEDFVCLKCAKKHYPELLEKI